MPLSCLQKPAIPKHTGRFCLVLWWFVCLCSLRRHTADKEQLLAGGTRKSNRLFGTTPSGPSYLGRSLEERGALV